jgi:hypothetical protein
MFTRIVFATLLMVSTAALAQTPFDHPCPDHTVPDRTITICTPTQSAQVRGRNVMFVGHVTDSLSFQTTTILDGQTFPPGTSPDLNFGIGFPNPGSHRITIQVTDSSGTFESSILVNTIDTPQTPCAAGPTNQTITICSPQDGDQETSPVELAAVTTDSNPLNATQVYVDGTKATEGIADEANFVLTHLILPPGPHRITYQAIEKSGLIIRKTINITVR